MTSTTRRIGIASAFGAVAVFAAVSRGAPGPFSFPHKPHLAADTMMPGAGDRDCRVCHDYSKGEREAHLAGCDKCHVDSAHLEKKLTGAYARPEFTHKEHLFGRDGKSMTCFTCHRMQVDRDWVEFTVPTGGLFGKDGAGAEKTCADCHATHEPKGGLVRQDEKTGDGKACAQCHLKVEAIEPLKYRPGLVFAATRPFLHEDHGGSSADCAQCHAGIKQSKTIWDYDAAKDTTAKCESCHVDAAGRTLVAPSDLTTTIQKIDFSNFPHAKHLGQFTRMECRTCHYPEKDEDGRKLFAARAATEEPVGREQLVKFAACDACHGQAGWAPDKPSWHVDNHGVGRWACFKCHEGGADTSGKLAVATAKVDRATLGPSRVTAHDHPGITSRGARLANATETVSGATKQCSDCHLGDLAALTSKLAGKPFAHDPHLPANPRTEDCLQCHSTSATSRRSEDLRRFDPSVAAPPTGAAAHARGCLECHVGATDRDLGLASPAVARTVAQFDHAGHVRAASIVPGAKDRGCTECHTAGGKFGYETPADVLSCTKCHSHDETRPEQFARTGPKTSSGEATKCLFCHDQVRGEENGRVGSPSRETFTRTHLQLRPGVQNHDKGGDCAACHSRDVDAQPKPYRERISKAAILLSIHDDPKLANEWFNNPAIVKAGVDAKGTCATCHRTEPRGYLRSLSGR